MKIQDLIQIAQELHLNEKAEELQFYEERLNNEDKDLILPLVGEFSSGKTTLINSLLDNPNLETASRATTASIFEIHFGADECSADILNVNGEVHTIQDVSDIKNKNLKSVEVVKVYDTSSRIGSSTILVDTPGLSSNDPAHQIALSTYLPNADAILLLTDVNQQMTRTLLNFLEASKLSEKPVYVVITKCDTKTPKEVEAAKTYIEKNIDFPFAKIITVSASQGEMSHFDELIKDIQQNKNQIIEKSITQRVKEIAKELLEKVNQLLKQGNSTEDINHAILEEEKKLERINRNIESLISETQSVIEENTQEACQQFAKNTFNRIDCIVKEQGRDCGGTISSTVNSTAVMIMQKFQQNMMTEILSLARKRKNKMEEVPMSALETIEIAEYAFNGFSSQIDVSSVGHEWDKQIGYGILGAVAVAAVVATGGTAAAAGAGGTAAAGGIAAAGTAAAGTAGSAGTIIAADAATDAAAALYTTHKIKKMTKMAQKAKMAKDFVDDVNSNLNEAQKYNQEIGQKVGMKRGFIETSVGWVTDFFAKPARQRAVNNYIDSCLLPEFKEQIRKNGSDLLIKVGSLLRKEAQTASQNVRDNLQTLKEQLNQEKETYQQKMATYQAYASKLGNI